MNFLGHFSLSQNNPLLLTGNFLGDFVKGKIQGFDKQILNGIRLHRFIDQFTDENIHVRNSKDLLLPHYGHYSRVIVDIFFDHFLAINWVKYHDSPLDVYAKKCYKILLEQKSIFPHWAIKTIDNMSLYNWLKNYQYAEGIKRSLYGISKRARFQNNMDEAYIHLEEHRKAFDVNFNLFYPEIQKASRKFIEQL